MQILKHISILKTQSLYKNYEGKIFSIKQYGVGVVSDKFCKTDLLPPTPILYCYPLAKKLFLPTRRPLVTYNPVA